MAAERQGGQTEVTKAAKETADHIETAVKRGDSNGYNSAMQEVNKFRDTHKPEETRAYVAAITKKFEEDKVLPTVALFEGKEAFKKIDTDGNGRLTKAELDAYGNRRDVNELQQNLIGNIQQKYDQIRNYNQSWENWHGGNSDAISNKDVEKGLAQQRGLNNLFAKNADGTSLYDRISNKDGNIEPGKLNDLLKLGKDNKGWITPEDKESLQMLKDNESIWQKIIPMKDDQKKEDIADLAKRNGTDLPTLQAQKPGTRDVGTGTSTGVVAPDEHAVQSQKAATEQKAREEKVKDALTVRSGESYSQAAERLLSLAGHSDPSGKEIRQVAHELWLADHKRKANGLKSHQVLELGDHLKKNAALSTLFQAS